MDQNNEQNRIRAVRNFDILCKCLDEKGWEYDADAEKMLVQLGVLGDDFPMPIILIVNEDLQLLSIASLLPFGISRERIVDICLAVTYANCHLTFGAFEFDMDERLISYMNSTCFANGDIGRETVELLINAACADVDRYNDRFFELEAGAITFEEFVSTD